MNTQSIKGRRVESVADVTQPGDFCFGKDRRDMFMILPGDTVAARIRLCGPTHPFWTWDGNEDKPTLHPSLDLPGVWHGWLQAGEFKSV